MNKKQLRIALLQSIASQLSEEGFILKVEKDRFIRPHQGVVDIFQLVFLDAKDTLRIQPNVSVRIECVENIFHQTSNFEAKFQNDTPTIGISVGHLIGGNNQACEFILRQNSEVLTTAKEIVSVFKKIALPYFQKYDSIKAIDAELNSEPTKLTLHRIAPWLRCATGIIVAKLVNRPNYDQLVQVYSKVMSSSDKGFYFRRFKALVKSLELFRGELQVEN